MIHDFLMFWLQDCKDFIVMTSSDFITKEEKLQYHVKVKLVIKQKIMQTIIESTWNSSMTTKKQIYFAMTCSLLSHEIIIWYMLQRMKNHWKDLNVKLKSVQEKALQ